MKFPCMPIRTLAVAALLLGVTACQDQPVDPVQPVQPTQDPQVSVPATPPAAFDENRAATATDNGIVGNDTDRLDRNFAAASNQLAQNDVGAMTSYALADMQPVGSSQTRGTVSFMADEVGGDGIRVIADFTNLPTGLHGIHIHENGDCSAPDASSAGGHFNPTDDPHAARSAQQRHIGDLGNIEADANNMASLDFRDDMLSFEGEESILGKAVIVHAMADDLMTQPSGAAGDRIACGVIEERGNNDLAPAG